MSKPFFLAASAVVLVTLAAALLGCGSSSAIVPTRFMIVADFDNNRVTLRPARAKVPAWFWGKPTSPPRLPTSPSPQAPLPLAAVRLQAQ